MYGNAYHEASSKYRQSDGSPVSTSSSYSTGYNSTSRLGNAFNEIFSAIGRVGYIILRIVLIFIGASLVLTGFLAILSFVMIFIFKYPGAFPHHGFSIDIGHFPGILDYMVNPSVAPWIIILSSVAFILPMIALIYWGVKMIFWFRVRDGIVNLAGLVLWVMSLAALAIILFNEGVSFSESKRITSENILQSLPDTLYVRSDNKLDNTNFIKEFSFPDNDFNVLLVDASNKIYIRPYLRLNVSDDSQGRVDIKKGASGRTEEEAERKAESLSYNYRISNDTLYLDNYFTIPAGNKWTGDFVNVDLYLPGKTVLYFDNSVEKLFHKRIRTTRINHKVVQSSIDYGTEPWELRNKYWVISDEGLKEVERAHPAHK